MYDLSKVHFVRLIAALIADTVDTTIMIG